MQKVNIPFDNTYAKLPSTFFSPAIPATHPEPKLIEWNEPLAEFLNIQSEGATELEKAQIFSGQKLPAGAQPIAMAYAGHQFGHFVPQLGDGRALLLGEVVAKNGERFDLHLKGSGPTEFSRRGDGKATLGPVLREYVVSEAMTRLGIPSSRSLAAILTGETIWREEALPGAILVRVARCHVRIGTFEYFAARGDLESLRRLTDYCIQRFYPEIQNAERPVLEFFKKVIAAQCELIPQWMAVGFIHGVMNTDNMCVIAQTLDFGPCAFIDEFQSNKVFSSIDRHGRYAYDHQPAIANWNLYVLAQCLFPIAGPEAEMMEAFREVLSEIPNRLEKNWIDRMSRKLGLESVPELVHKWLSYLQKESLDFTLSFRELSRFSAKILPASHLKITDEFRAFHTEWLEAIGKSSKSAKEISSLMDSVNPLYIPRNHLVEKAIRDAHQENYDFFRRLNHVLEKPFAEQAGCEEFSRPPEPHERVSRTFCGT